MATVERRDYLLISGYTDKMGDRHEEFHMVTAMTDHEAFLKFKNLLGRSPRTICRVTYIDTDDWDEDYFDE